MNNKYTKEKFIEKAKLVHGNKYDYSKVEYKGMKEKVCIICPEHGEFWQTPDHHIQGNGCPICRYKKSGEKKKIGKINFINRSKKIHGNKYDYSKVEYINNSTKVCIICPEHGEFWQTPANHLNGHGCPNCSKNKKIGIEEFIEKAKKIHGNKYDYSKVEYVNSKTKVCIICPEHGEFWQTPSCHILRAQGCPICNESKIEKEIKNLLIMHNFHFEEQKRFKWLGQQSLDFYLPDYNLAIECQGEQHFKSIDFGGNGKTWAEQRLIYVQKLDREKYEKCLKNNIRILYYSLKHYNSRNIIITNKNLLIEKIKNGKNI